MYESKLPQPHQSMNRNMSRSAQACHRVSAKASRPVLNQYNQKWEDKRFSVYSWGKREGSGTLETSHSGYTKECTKERWSKWFASLPCICPEAPLKNVLWDKVMPQSVTKWRKLSYGIYIKIHEKNIRKCTNKTITNHRGANSIWSYSNYVTI